MNRLAVQVDIIDLSMECISKAVKRVKLLPLSAHKRPFHGTYELSEQVISTNAHPEVSITYLMESHAANDKENVWPDSHSIHLV